MSARKKAPVYLLMCLCMFIGVSMQLQVVFKYDFLVLIPYCWSVALGKKKKKKKKKKKGGGGGGGGGGGDALWICSENADTTPIRKFSHWSHIPTIVDTMGPYLRRMLLTPHLRITLP